MGWCLETDTPNTNKTKGGDFTARRRAAAASRSERGRVPGGDPAIQAETRRRIVRPNGRQARSEIFPEDRATIFLTHLNSRGAREPNANEKPGTRSRWWETTYKTPHKTEACSHPRQATNTQTNSRSNGRTNTQQEPKLGRTLRGSALSCRKGIGTPPELCRRLASRSKGRAVPHSRASPPSNLRWTVHRPSSPATR